VAELSFYSTGVVVHLARKRHLEVVLVPSAYIDERAAADCILCIAGSYPSGSVALKFQPEDFVLAKRQLETRCETMLCSLYAEVSVPVRALITGKPLHPHDANHAFAIGGWIVKSAHNNFHDAGNLVISDKCTFALVWAELFWEGACFAFRFYSDPNPGATCMGRVACNFVKPSAAETCRICGRVLVLGEATSLDNDNSAWEAPELTFITFHSHQELHMWVCAGLAAMQGVAAPSDFQEVARDLEFARFGHQKCLLPKYIEMAHQEEELDDPIKEEAQEDLMSERFDAECINAATGSAMPKYSESMECSVCHGSFEGTVCHESFQGSVCRW